MNKKSVSFGQGREGDTSQKYPVRVDMVDAHGGLPIGMTSTPGKVQSLGQSGAGKQRLGEDLDRIKGYYGASDLVCLVEDHELERLGISHLAEACADRNIELHRLPIPDFGTPELDDMLQLVRKINSLREQGHQLVVHCMGGLGRTGTVAACCLVRLGIAPDHALKDVRLARPGTVESAEQEDFIYQFAAYIR